MYNLPLLNTNFDVSGNWDPFAVPGFDRHSFKVWISLLLFDFDFNPVTLSTLSPPYRASGLNIQHPDISRIMCKKNP